MGGYGSGRDGSRTTVEDCRALDVNRFVSEGVIRPGRWGRGSWVWRNAYGEQTSLIGYEVDTTDMSAPYLRVIYTLTNSGFKVDEVIRLTLTKPYTGGVRFWFSCPRCGRRSGKLYLPPGGQYFRCRRCYNLTYESCNESHKYDGLLTRIAVEAKVPARTVKALFGRRRW